ncbi:DUF4349 domain-containing protein [Pseudoduganella violacea]|uniref:Putative coiled-coil protein SlyX n=1 Tax=Pseudoduganella violacea TaxID=1715466 RepID=A0A7W5BAQ6_9BURK|nr:putative coiled-coil protein SlyX [Pseudoduganella violacea]
MKRFLLMAALLALLSACSSKQEAGGAQGGGANASQPRGKHLAYEHSIAVDAAEDAVKPLMDKLVAACNAEAQQGCVLLEASLDTGREKQAHIRMRAKPEAVVRLSALATAGGTVARQETRAEDLARPIADSEKRLAMLRSYQKKLEELESRSANNADNLIKVSKELAGVQSELEQASGENARLLERVNLDVLSVAIYSQRSRSFWSPIARACDEFASNLSQGIASTVVGLAYIIPWTLILLALFFGGRKLWRRAKSKRA